MRGTTIDGVLGPTGALASRLPGWEHRPQQLEMARAVESALTQGQHLVVEAGTGTGKTLAYLVPAALSGRRVIVSTATRTLQEQVFFKDVPLLRDALGMPVEVALLKGRSNYLCNLKLDAFAKQPTFATPQDARQWEAFRAWAQATRTGDRGDTRLDESWSGWPHVTTTTDACLAGRCPQLDECFVTRARRHAAETPLVVVNHALFFADLALKARDADLALGVLPPYDAVIFDEAHALEDVATEHFGRAVSSGRLLTLSRDALAALTPLDTRSATLSPLALSLKTRAEALFAEVSRTLGVGGSGGAVRLTPASLERTRPAADGVLETLGALAAVCPDDDDVLGGLHRRALDLAQTLDEVLRAEDDTQVYWAQAQGPGLSLKCAPIDVGESLGEHLLSQVRTAVFTSATLAAPSPRPAAPFDYVLKRFGLKRAGAKARCATLRLDTPFDYAKQAGLYLPPALPEPSAPGWTQAFAQEVKSLVRLTQGRAFVLFTSLRQLDAVCALLEHDLGVPVLKQGRAPRRALLEDFVKRPSVLFASASFWEGVDVPGEALSLVVIDKLPFAPPNDPLEAARIAQVKAQGGDGFSDYQVPRAALSLRQGFGRLIRTATDFGLVALGDVRVRTRRYGQAFLEALPPARRLHSLDEVRAFWEARPAP